MIKKLNIPPSDKLPELEKKPYKPVEEMTAQEVIELPVFTEQLQSCIDEIDTYRKDLEAKAYEVRTVPNRNVADRLEESGLWNTFAIKALYKKLLEGSKNTGLSSRERVFIRLLGNQALHDSIQYLKVEAQRLERDKQNENKKD